MPSAPAKPVFISYARDASAAQAKALHHALGADSFLDESDPALAERFPEVLADALLGSRVVVVFADEEYFRRWYCLWELRTALGPAAFAGQSVARLDERSLQHLVIALPADGTRPEEFGRLPPALASGDWPRAAFETARIAERVQARLRASPGPLSQRYAEAGQAVELVKARLVEVAATPPPRSLAGLRTYPPAFPPPLRTYPPALPPPLKAFVGRSHDLWRVDFALSTFRAGASGPAEAINLEGGPGFGRSALASEYLHRFGPARFPGGLFWINAEEPLDAQLHGALQTLRDVPDFPEFLRQRRDASKELELALEAEAANAPILWVVDNIPPDGAPLPAYCPALGKVTVLTISRRRGRDVDPSMSLLSIGVLDVAPAVELLAAGLSAAPPRRDCEIIAEWVGWSPVPLAVLNASLRLKRMTVPELARALEQTISTGLGGTEHAFALAYDRLSPGAQQAARLIARLARAPIPMALLRHLGLWTEVRGELIETSFVDEVGPEPRGVRSAFPMLGTMHPGLAEYVRTRASDATAEVIRAVAALTTMLGEASTPRDGWRALLLCAPHARHLLRVTHPTRGTVQIPLVLRAALAGALATASSEVGRREGTLDAILEAVEAFRRLEGMAPDAFDPELADALNNLAAFLGGQGRREDALVAIEDAVEIHRRLAKTTPDVFEPRLADSLSHLSRVLSDLGRTEDATAADREAAEIRARVDQKHA